ncbi:MAG: SgcJ/EcaC family oxidoreductase [Rhizobiales bacterium]|nr:SgcJ/EcaC family oxidoreductase [Hyphomicrobiales bacterium]
MTDTGKQTQASDSLPAGDAAAIGGLITQLTRAWNAGDGTAYGAGFTETCDYVTFNGDRLRGRQAVAESHQALFDTHLKGSRITFETVDVKPLDAATMLVHSIGNSRLAGQKTFHPSRRSIQTLVAVREGTGWRFAAFHNTRIFAITPWRALLMKFGI